MSDAAVSASYGSCCLVRMERWNGLGVGVEMEVADVCRVGENEKMTGRSGCSRREGLLPCRGIEL